MGDTGGVTFSSPFCVRNVLLAERHPSERKGEKTAGKGHRRGAKHKIPQKRIDISLIPAII